MNNQFFKRIPFDLELAKKITNKEVKGEIVTRDGRQARIICFDRKENEDIFDPPKNIVALVANKDGSEIVFAFRDDGMILLDKETCYDLQIEVPTYNRDYSNFKPCTWQSCLVRDTASDLWKVGVCCGTDSYGVPIFYSANNSDGYCHWKYFLPLTKVTECLFCTYKSYKELIKELDKNGQD